MGELEKEKGAWGYVEGGMGQVSEAIASSARSHGADIFTEKVFRLWSYRASVDFKLRFHLHLRPTTGCGPGPGRFRRCSEGSGAERWDGDPQQSGVIKRHSRCYLQETYSAGIPEITAPTQRHQEHYYYFYCLWPSRRRVSFLQSSSAPWSRSITPRLLPKSMVNAFCHAKQDVDAGTTVQHCLSFMALGKLLLKWHFYDKAREPTLTASILASYSGSRPSAKLPCGSHGKRRARASPSVLHSHQLWKRWRAGDGVQGGLERTPLIEVRAVVPLIANARSLLQIPLFTFRFYSSALIWKAIVLHVEMTSRHFG